MALKHVYWNILKQPFGTEKKIKKINFILFGVFCCCFLGYFHVFSNAKIHCHYSSSITHRVSRQGALVPKFVLLWVVFTLFPIGGDDEPVHKEGYDHLCHLVHQLGHYQQRC